MIYYIHAYCYVLFITDTLEFKFYKTHILNKLGSSYPAFFQHLGLTPEQVQIAQGNNNRNADGAMQELWNKYVDSFIYSS